MAMVNEDSLQQLLKERQRLAASRGFTIDYQRRNHGKMLYAIKSWPPQHMKSMIKQLKIGCCNSTPDMLVIPLFVTLSPCKLATFTQLEQGKEFRQERTQPIASDLPKLIFICDQNCGSQ